VEKVEFSEWATPNVRKDDGTTRSCGDYGVTVKPQLNVQRMDRVPCVGVQVAIGALEWSLLEMLVVSLLGDN